MWICSAVDAADVSLGPGVKSRPPGCHPPHPAHNAECGSFCGFQRPNGSPLTDLHDGTLAPAQPYRMKRPDLAAVPHPRREKGKDTAAAADVPLELPSQSHCLAPDCVAIYIRPRRPTCCLRVFAPSPCVIPIHASPTQGQRIPTPAENPSPGLAGGHPPRVPITSTPGCNVETPRTTNTQRVTGRPTPRHLRAGKRTMRTRPCAS